MIENNIAVIIANSYLLSYCKVIEYFYHEKLFLLGKFLKCVLHTHYHDTNI